MKTLNKKSPNFRIDAMINTYLMKYQRKHKEGPKYISKEDWDEIVDKMVFLSDQIYLNDKSIIGETDQDKIDSTCAESYAMRVELFKLINDCWEEFCL